MIRADGSPLFLRFGVFPTEEPRNPTTGVRATGSDLRFRIQGQTGNR
jgi:hypothetical protein